MPIGHGSGIGHGCVGRLAGKNGATAAERGQRGCIVSGVRQGGKTHAGQMKPRRGGNSRLADTGGQGRQQRQNDQNEPARRQAASPEVAIKVQLGSLAPTRRAKVHTSLTSRWPLSSAPTNCARKATVTSAL